MLKYIDDYIAYKQRENLHPDTITIYKRILLEFCAFLEKQNYSLLTIDREKILEYFGALDREESKSSSINQQISAIKGFFGFLYENNIISNNPTISIKYQRNIKDGKELKNDEIYKAIKYLEEKEDIELRDRLILYLIVKYGFRGADICKLRINDISSSGKYLTIKRKGESTKIESPKINELLSQYLEAASAKRQSELFITQSGKPLQRPQIIYIVKRFTNLIGLSGSSLVSFSSKKEGKRADILAGSRFSKIKNIIKFDDYQMLRVTDRENENKIIVTKIFRIKKDDKKRLVEIKNELKILTVLKHNNIIHTNEIIEEERKDEIVIYCTIDDFEGHYLPFYVNNLNTNEFAKIGVQLLETLIYLHNNNIFIRSFAPETIFINKEDDKITVKLTDLQNAVKATESDLYPMKNNIYAAPELRESNIPSQLSDQFTLGTILFYLLYNKLPYSKGYRSHKFSSKRKDSPDDLLEIVHKMVSLDSSSRFKDLIECKREFSRILGVKSDESDVNYPNRIKFSIRIIDELKDINSALSRFLIKSNFPALVKIKADIDDGKNYLINEISNFSTINSINIHKFNLANDFTLELFINLFIDKNPSDIAELQAEQDYNSSKISLFSRSISEMHLKTPLILIIDNFDLATSDFSDFLLHLLRSLVKKREELQIFLIYSEEGKQQNFFDSADNLLSESEGQLSTVLLPFEREKIAKIINQEFKGEVSDDIVDYIFIESNGRIGKIIEIVNFLLDGKHLGFDTEKKKIVFKDSFFKFKKDRYFEALDSRELMIVNIIACLRKRLELTLLFAVLKKIDAKIEENEAINIINSLAKRNILMLYESKFVYFVNDYLVNLCYQNIARDAKIKIHSAIATTLEKLSNGDEESQEEISSHYLLSENIEKATYYLKSKALKSKELGLLNEALSIYERLNIFFDKYNEEQIFEILSEKISIFIELYNLNRAREEIERARQYASRNDEQTIRFFLARILLKEGNIKEGLTTLEYILDSTDSKSGKIYSDCIRYKISALMSLGRFKELSSFIENKINELVAIDDDNLRESKLCSLKNSQALNYFYMGDPLKALAILHEIINNYCKLNNKINPIKMYHNMGIVYYNIYDFDKALTYFNMALKIANESFDIVSKSIILLNIAGINHRMGNFKEALSQYEEIENIFYSVGSVRNYENMLLGYCLLKISLGLLDEARKLERAVEDFAIERGNRLLLSNSYAARGEIERTEGHFHLALEYYERASDYFKKNNLGKQLAEINIYKSEVYLKMGRYDDAIDTIAFVKEIPRLEQFPDLLMRLEIQEILVKLHNAGTSNVNHVDGKLNEIRQNKLLTLDWETNFNFQRTLALFKQHIDKESEFKEIILKLKNEMNRAIGGLDLTIKNSFFGRSEFGKHLIQIESPKIGKAKEFSRSDLSNLIIGVSEKMTILRNSILQASRSNEIVLIEGESGTGKELVARLIHDNSSRKENTFLPLNCASFKESIFEAELFGYKKGAFTGADTDRRGLFESAESGTLFLDEVGEIDPRVQQKLLRFIQTGEIRRVGDDSARQVDIRIICATNKNLSGMVEKNLFRLDLFSRLNVISIKIPPLRERKEDIPLLIHNFIEYYNATSNETVHIDDELILALQRYEWPGNIRELENEIKKFIVLRDGNKIDLSLIEGDTRFKVLPTKEYLLKKVK